MLMTLPGGETLHKPNRYVANQAITSMAIETVVQHGPHFTNDTLKLTTGSVICLLLDIQIRCSHQMWFKITEIFSRTILTTHANLKLLSVDIRKCPRLRCGIA